MIPLWYFGYVYIPVPPEEYVEMFSLPRDWSQILHSNWKNTLNLAYYHTLGQWYYQQVSIFFNVGNNRLLGQF